MLCRACGEIASPVARKSRPHRFGWLVSGGYRGCACCCCSDEGGRHLKWFDCYMHGASGITEGTIDGGEVCNTCTFSSFTALRGGDTGTPSAAGLSGESVLGGLPRERR
eukprot:IDg16247t1